MFQNIDRSLGNEVYDESRRRINSGHVCYYSVLKLNIPSSSHIAKDQDIQNSFLWVGKAVSYLEECKLHRGRVVQSV
jgi:hypothetical protein